MLDISVITPTFNRAHLLPRVWKSLIFQTAQFEWIVIDDGSIDNTKPVLKSFSDERIRYTALEKNRGVNAARNAGVKLATGRYVVFLDSDDELYPQGLQCMIETMDEANYSIGVASFACAVAKTRKNIHDLIDHKVLDEYSILCENALRGGDTILVYRREVFDDFSLPETFRGCEQIFVYEVSKKWKFLLINKPLSIIHRQTDNLSNSNSLIERSFDIARSFEVILANHSRLLKKHPNAEFNLLKRALYRYGIAGSRKDQLRIYRKITQRRSFKNSLFTTLLLVYCMLCPVYFERWRINRLNHMFTG